MRAKGEAWGRLVGERRLGYHERLGKEVGCKEEGEIHQADLGIASHLFHSAQRKEETVDGLPNCKLCMSGAEENHWHFIAE